MELASLPCLTEISSFSKADGSGMHSGLQDDSIKKKKSPHREYWSVTWLQNLEPQRDLGPATTEALLFPCPQG